MRVEVVYMVEHDDEPPPLRVYRRQHGAGSIAGRDEDSSENEEEEFEENPLFADAATLAEAQRQMHRQMKAKDKEIAHLNAKMTEMMTQMTMMMQMIQRNTANPIPVQQTNHQATSSGLANPPAHHVPQVSGVRGSHEGGIESDRLIRQPTPQNVASTSEPVTVAQLETIINEKIKAVIASDQAEKLVGKGRPYPAEYDQAPYPKGYSVPKFNTFNGSGNNNPRQHLAQFKATCGNTGGNDALLFRQFVSSLTSTAFECHPIEDCYIFKDWLERKYQKGELTLSDNVLAHPRKESTRVVTSSSIPPTEEERTEKKQTQGEQWETAISKKTTKMLKQLEGVPGVKWKSPTEPVLDLKALPLAQTSTFKQRPNQAGSSKSGKEKSPKRKTKLKKFKEKMTATQRAIDCLDEYYQTVRRPIKLADFMSELKVAEAEEADEELFPVGTCRVVSVTPVAPIKDKYVNELVVEICLATSSMDYSSEEDLYFPREVESEHDITSQMEHVQLEGDSELDGESLDAMMADSGEDAPSNDSEPDEIAQVQLRSGKRLLPPPKKGVSNKDKGKEIVINEAIIPEDPKKKDTSAKVFVRKYLKSSISYQIGIRASLGTNRGLFLTDFSGCFSYRRGGNC
ncbi:hypothetical protein M5K25_025186 [Dendrobium thyrsiflorum]|uniref:Uncharacterized protein n=1 Tax=Dendrobium thyrsiflorum TaxID=117978 RepID=A0ABD0U907_DENTH